jgi:hypothetical protein
MKRLVFPASLLLFLSCSAADSSAEGAAPFPTVWEVTEGVNNPESAYFDAASGHVFVSQIGGGGPTGKDGDGYISKLTLQGQVVAAKWVTGLNAPKGLRSSGGTLWVSDISRLIAIDIEQGEIIKEIDVPDAKFLNDVACGDDGAVYVSDMSANKIYRYHDPQLSVFAEGDQLESPNGLLVAGDRLIVAAWGSGSGPDGLGRLFSLDLQTKAKTPLMPAPLGNLDGVEAVDGKGFLVSDFNAGKVYYVRPEGSARIILRLPKGAADIGYLADRRLLIVPQMLENKITAFELRRPSGTSSGPP